MKFWGRIICGDLRVSTAKDSTSFSLHTNMYIFPTAPHNTNLVRVHERQTDYYFFCPLFSTKGLTFVMRRAIQVAAYGYPHILLTCVLLFCSKTFICI